MSIGTDDKDVIRSALTRAVGSGTSAKPVADVAHTHWQDVVSSLEPVIGASGVQALYERCLHLQRIPAHEPASSALPTAHAPSFLAARHHLETQAPADALEAAVAFFGGFTALLSSLIGATLTTRLLKPVWADGYTDPAPESER